MGPHRFSSGSHDPRDCDACVSGGFGQRNDVCPGIKGKFCNSFGARRVAERVPTEHDEVVSSASLKGGVTETTRGEHCRVEEYEADEHEGEACGESTGAHRNECDEEKHHNTGNGRRYRRSAERDNLRDSRGVVQPEQLWPGTHEEKAREGQHECCGKNSTGHG